MKCKITSEKIKPFMTFGKMPLANGFLDKRDFDSEFSYEMEVGFSEKVSFSIFSIFLIFKFDISLFTQPLKSKTYLFPLLLSKNFLFCGSLIKNFS